MIRKRHWFNRLIGHTLILINIFVVCWLGLCFAAANVDPVKIKYLSAFSLTTPFALAANLIMAGIWLFSYKKWRVLISLIPLILCWKMVPAIFGIHYFKKNDWQATANSFKIMTWNVHAMGIFNHPNEKKHARGIMDLIHKESPDILCLPEYSVPTNLAVPDHTKKIMSENGYTTYRFNMENGYGPHIWIGSAVFSRFPLVDYEVYTLNPYISLLQCDFRLPHSEIIRVCILHLQSFGLTDADKAIIEEVKKNKVQKIKTSRSFAWKFNEAYRERAMEAKLAIEIIKDSPYPLIICGDFNDLPFSYTYALFDKTYTDAFTLMGRGFGRTYNQIIPTLRIDHIFFNEGSLRLKAFKSPFSPFSDHSPVIAHFEYLP